MKSLISVLLAVMLSGCLTVAGVKVSTGLNINTINEAYVELEAVAILARNAELNGVITKKQALRIKSKLQSVKNMLDVGAIGVSKQDTLDSVEQILLSVHGMLGVRE